MNVKSVDIQRLDCCERRFYRRVKVDIAGWCIFENKDVRTCSVVDISPGGAALCVSGPVSEGEEIVAYLDPLGRISGKVVRKTENGFAMTIEALDKKRDKLASQLTWLANCKLLRFPEDRRHSRYVPIRQDTVLVIYDGTEVKCRLLNISLSGAAIELDEPRPAVGDYVTVGNLRSRVVRTFVDGIAVEFCVVQTQDVLEENLLI